MAFVDDVDTLGATWHVRLDETSGTTANDRVSTDDFTIGAAATLNQSGGGDDGNAGIDLDGSTTGNWIENQSTTDGVSCDVAKQHNRSVFVAFKSDDNTAGPHVIWIQGGGTAGNFAIYIQDSNIYGGYGQASGLRTFASTTAPATGSFHTAALVQDNTAEELYFYLNGSQVGTALDVSSIGTGNTASLVVLGCAQGSSTNSEHRLLNHDGNPFRDDRSEFDGVIDEAVYFSDIVLTSTQINDLHDVYLNGSGTTVLQSIVRRSLISNYI